MTDIDLKKGQCRDVRANVATFQRVIKKISDQTPRHSRGVKIQRRDVETQRHDVTEGRCFAI